MDGSIYDEKYFIEGKKHGLSLYENYRFLPNLTGPMCRRIFEYLHMDEDDTVCDFGCARGYVVRAFREMGMRAYGFDVSEWAIKNCDPTVRNNLWQIQGRAKSSNFAASGKKFDFVLAKDVLEHIPDDELDITIDVLMAKARKAVFVVVPLSPQDGAPYVVPSYEDDVTHVQRLTLGSWAQRLQRLGFCVSACHLVPGIKDNYRDWAQGNGFLTCRREVQL